MPAERRRRPRRRSRAQRRACSPGTAGRCRGDGRGQGGRVRARPGPDGPGGAGTAARPGSGWRSCPRRWRCARPGSTRRCWPGCTVPGDAYAAAVAADVDLGVSARWALAEVAAAARGDRLPARVHLKVDTGLGRNGVDRSTTGPTWSPPPCAAQADGAIELVGALSHFAWADAPTHPTVARADRRLRRRRRPPPSARGARLRCGTWPTPRPTLTNPAAALRPGAPGAGGVRAVAGPGRSRPRPSSGCVPAMTAARRGSRWSSGCRPAHGVSYGHAYTHRGRDDPGAGAARLRRRPAPPRRQRRPGRLGGRRHTVAGRVCMDQVVVDLGRRRRRSPPATWPSCSAPATGGEPDRAGLGGRRRHHQLRDRQPASAPGCRAGTSAPGGRPEPAARRPGLLSLGVGLAAAGVGAAIGLAAERAAVVRVRPRRRAGRELGDGALRGPACR